MEDKLGLSLEDIIKKEKQDKKQNKPQSKRGGRGGRGGQAQGRQQKMHQRTGVVNAPSARDKAQMLRQNKVNSFGANRGYREPFKNGKKFTTRGREELGDREDWRQNKPKPESRGSQLSSKLKVSNLNNSISNEDLNVLFRNIGPLKE